MKHSQRVKNCSKLMYINMQLTHSRYLGSKISLYNDQIYIKFSFGSCRFSQFSYPAASVKTVALYMVLETPILHILYLLVRHLRIQFAVVARRHISTPKAFHLQYIRRFGIILSNPS